MFIAGLQLTSRQPCWGTTTKRFPPLGTKLFYHANSAKKFFIVLTTNMAALSRGCKRSIKWRPTRGFEDELRLKGYREDERKRQRVSNGREFRAIESD